MKERKEDILTGSASQHRKAASSVREQKGREAMRLPGGVGVRATVDEPSASSIRYS